MALSLLLKGHRPFRVLIVVGQKRSGNHAFLNWYMSQFPGISLLFNNVSTNQYPLDRHRQELRLKSLRASPVLIFSYEDETPQSVLAGQLRNFLSKHEGQIKDIRLCLVVRDPRNLIASRMKKWPEEFENPDLLSKVREAYLHNADLALSSPPCFDGLPFVPVFYNALISSPAYRSRLAAQLGIPDGVKGLDEVLSYGHGSSFDGQDKDGNAGDMAVFSRWQAFSDDPRFIAVFDTPEMRDMIASFDRSSERPEPWIPQ